MSDLPVRAIIVAGGQGRRMGGELPKQYQMLSGRPLICHTLEVFQSHSSIDSIALVVNSNSVDYCRSMVLGTGEFTKVDKVVVGGGDRSESVRNGLTATADDTDGVILVHDAVRPFVSAKLIERVVMALQDNDAVVPCLPIVDSIKKIVDGRVQATLDRNELYRIQTPQGFLRSVLEEAYAGNGFSTDDAGLVERIGVDVVGIEGEERNIKITKPEDWLWGQLFLTRDSF